MEAALAKLTWSKPAAHPVNGKRLLIKKARPSGEFWEAYRGLTDEWYKVGITANKAGGSVWWVKWWSDEDGKFTVKELKRP